MEFGRVNFVAGVPMFESDNGVKRSRFLISPSSVSSNTGLQNCNRNRKPEKDDVDDDVKHTPLVATVFRPSGSVEFVDVATLPKFGVASVCGRRRDMEDAVTIYPSFLNRDNDQTSCLHYYGVYDGHGCSHVATRCKDRLHLFVKEELSKTIESTEWTKIMEQSFNRMDREVTDMNKGTFVSGNCGCDLQSPDSDTVGSTAVIAITTPDRIIVANCGDSRAVLCRNGKSVPLSIDHKPDRPDELHRIEAAGGRVIYWQGARVLGVLAMSRAIGDSYLKPFVSCEPEVTITDRTDEDECLIIASDGLWDVVSNETACGVASMCLKGKGPTTSKRNPVEEEAESCDRACSDASALLTKLALARRSSDNVTVVVIDLRKE